MKSRALVLLFLFIVMAGVLHAQGVTVTVGTGTAAQRQPLGINYGYEKDASLYLASEIVQSGYISKIGWLTMAGNTAIVPYKIYLKNTAQATVTSSTWSDMVTGATLVHNDASAFNTIGYSLINLTTSFYYTGGNLLVLVETNYGATGSVSYPTFAFTYDGSSSHQYWAADSAPPTGVGTVTMTRPNVQLFFPPAPTAPVFNVSPGILDFGAVATGTSQLIDVTVSNQGGDTLRVNSVTLTGDATFFTEGIPISEVAMTAGQSFSFQVRYTPVSPDVTNNGMLNISESDGTVHSVEVSGTGYSNLIHTYPYVQTFDAVTFPPQGWTGSALSGTTPFVRVTSGSNPTCDPYSGLGMVMYNSFNASAGSTAMLVTPPCDVTLPGMDKTLSFWMYRDSDLPANLDKIELYMNGTPDLSGSPDLLLTIHRNITASPVETGSNGWFHYSVSPTVISYDNVYFIFKATAGYGNNMFFDAFTFGDMPLSLNPNPATIVLPGDGSTDISLQPTLEWSAGSGVAATGYFLSLGTDNPPTNILNMSDNSTATFYDITSNLSSLTTYYWQVTPYNTHGNAMDCPVWSFTTLDQPSPFVFSPASVDFGTLSAGQSNSQDMSMGNQGPTPTIITVSSITLAGDPDFSLSFTSGPLPYELGVGSFGPFFSVGFSPVANGMRTATLSITEDNSPTPHYVTLTGYGSDFVPNPATLIAPANGATGISYNSPMLEWQAGTGAVPSGYNLYFGMDYPPAALLTSLTQTWTYAPVMEPNTTYYWQAVPYNSFGLATGCPVWSFTTQDPIVTYDPIISATPNPLSFEANETQNGSTSFTLSNTGSAQLTFNVSTESSSWLILNPASGSINAGSSLTIDVTSLGQDLPAGENFGLIILENNDPLSISYMIDVQLYVNPAPMVVNFTADTTIGHTPLTVVFTDTSHFGPQLPYSSITGWHWDFQNDGIIDSYDQHPTFTFTGVGHYTVSLTVITNTGSSFTEVKTDFITTTNQAPIVIAPLGAVTILEDQSSAIITMTNYFSDPDGDALEFSVSPSPNFTFLINGPDVQFIPVQNWFGSETFTVFARDMHKGAVSQTIAVDVTAVNDAPLFDMNTYQYFIRNSHFALDFAALVNDIDNPDSELTLLIQNTSVPANITVSYTPDTPGSLTATFFAPDNWAGSNSFHITVNDNMGRALAHAYPTFIVLPVFNATFHTNLAGVAAPTGLTGQVVEFYDDTLGNVDQWAWNFGDSSPVATAQNPTHIYMDPGTYTVTLTVTNIETGSTDDYALDVVMEGTAVGGSITNTQTWGDEIINLLPGTVIQPTGMVNMLDGGTINVLDSTAVQVFGELTANGVTFRGQNGNEWAGLYFAPHDTRIQSTLTGCNFVDATTAITIDGSDVILDDCTFAPADTSLIIAGVGIKVMGVASPELSNLMLQNYASGLEFTGDNSRTLSTPTLTNVRVRNSESTTRDRAITTGITFSGEASPVLSNVSVENYTTGLVFDNGVTRTLTTPTLTNVRVRNSSSTTRADTKGIVFTGQVSPTLLDTQVDSCTVGIEFNNGNYNAIQTPTLTNVRVRNSVNTTRGIDIGIAVNSTNLLRISNSDIEGYSTGIKVINDGVRTISTPTLTNVRVRNSISTTRLEDAGIVLSGDVAPMFRDLDIVGYSLGLNFDGSGTTTRTITTPTLTNVRVRNSENTTRVFTTGMSISNVERIIVDNSEILGYNTGIKILNPAQTRTLSTPTLTNVRVRNSESTTRDENIGVLLGTGVAGRMELCNIAQAAVGILIADGNHTVLKENLVMNCATGIRAVGTLAPLPLKTNMFKLDTAYADTHPTLSFVAIELLNAGPWSVRNNTMWGYPKALKAINAEVLFQNNIVWASSPLTTPFEFVNSPVHAELYNDIYYTGGFEPLSGNFAADPLFVDLAANDYHLTYNSPCIDAGNPLLPRDEDGTVADVGAYTYLHNAKFIVDAMFITPGHMVNFRNKSIGHVYPGITTYDWDLNNDGSVESHSLDWSYDFPVVGHYTVRLVVTTGNLVDQIIMTNAVVVQNEQLPSPTDFQIHLVGDDVHLQWSPVSYGLGQNTMNVSYYLVYQNDGSDDIYTFVDHTANGITSFTATGGATFDKRFYFVIGFAGTWTELNRFIGQHQAIRKSAAGTIDYQSEQSEVLLPSTAESVNSASK